MSYTMRNSKSFADLAARFLAGLAACRVLQQRLLAALGQASGSEREQILAGSVDRFEVERRERAWNRWQSQDGSLLGR
jgi:hypothetical protein